MILSDFLTLEVYFSNEESARFFEDVSTRYGAAPLAKCIVAGELVCRRIHIGPDAGRALLWLTDKGRMRAQSRL